MYYRVYALFVFTLKLSFNDITYLKNVQFCFLGLNILTLLSSAQVMILITGAHKAFALYKAIEEGVNHMWTVSAFQQHPRTIFVCDEDATLELRVKTVKYFKGANDSCSVLVLLSGE